jgi:hypothetical protein
MADANKQKTNRPIKSYRDFWPYYLQEHADPRTRALHYFGTSLSTLCVLAGLGTGNVWFVPAALLAGYGPAWTSHFFVEHNRPATFTYPFWSLASDYRMTWRWLTGRIGADLDRAGVPNR